MSGLPLRNKYCYLLNLMLSFLSMKTLNVNNFILQFCSKKLVSWKGGKTVISLQCHDKKSRSEEFHFGGLSRLLYVNRAQEPHVNLDSFTVNAAR